MPSNKPARRVQDMIENAQAIFRYTTGMDSTSFEEDCKTYDAVERCLERIAEASAKLGDLDPFLMPDQPWRKIRGLGNQLRHEYYDIVEDWLWEIVRTDLPSLNAACEDALRQIQPDQRTR